MMQKYELWFSATENAYELIAEVVDSSVLLARAQDAKLIASFEAESWEAAQAFKHKFLGWEPYRGAASDAE